MLAGSGTGLFPECGKTVSSRFTEDVHAVRVAGALFRKGRFIISGVGMDMTYFIKP
jgi:hypothetical protein